MLSRPLLIFRLFKRGGHRGCNILNSFFFAASSVIKRYAYAASHVKIKLTCMGKERNNQPFAFRRSIYGGSKPQIISMDGSVIGCREPEMPLSRLPSTSNTPSSSSSSSSFSSPPPMKSTQFGCPHWNQSSLWSLDTSVTNEGLNGRLRSRFLRRFRSHLNHSRSKVKNELDGGLICLKHRGF